MYVIKELNNIQDRINLTNKRMRIVNIVNAPHNQVDFEPDVEKIVVYDHTLAWETYSFILRKVLYRMRCVLEALISIIDDVKNIKLIDDGDVFVPVYPQYEPLFYDFEDMLVSFLKAYEGEYIEDVIRCFNKSCKDEFNNNLPRRNDVDGLFWKINILRNRVAHSTGGRYLNKDSKASRFTDFSSQAKMIRVNSESIAMECSLVDIDKNPEIKQVIKDVLIEKKCGEGCSYNNIFDLLFPDRSPKGHNKKHPNMVLPIIGCFNYFSSFISLSNQMLDYIDNQILVFIHCGVEHCTTDALSQKWIFEGEDSVSVGELYDVDLKTWK